MLFINYVYVRYDKLLIPPDHYLIFIIIITIGETVTHYTSLNMLVNKYGSQGFTVLGYPCNQFGGQEPGKLVTYIYTRLVYNIKVDNYSRVIGRYSYIE